MSVYRSVFSVILSALLIGAWPLPVHAGKGKDRVKRDFSHIDADGNGKIDPREWNRRGNFLRIDRNGDGTISLKELRRMYKDHGDRDYDWPPEGYPAQTVLIDETIAADKVPAEQISKDDVCGISGSITCDRKAQESYGLLPTGTGPSFPADVVCPGMDDYWAMDYSHKRTTARRHGGMDLPVPWGTPMRAVADGSVVALYEAHMSKRGIEIVLRHSPEQTGLPFWTYSTYGHMDKMPLFEIGQRVKRGDILGPTGNTGQSSRGGGQSKNRRPAIHFATFYAPTPKYGEVKNVIIPVDGRWLDPMAFYRLRPPFDTPAIQALADAEKAITPPILLEDGTTIPAETKVIWPYTCRKD